ncbi:MAG TPA: DUF3352 domain-containing protein [Thermoguttaceae bacterium]|nr:DUF3352 domain-containing protein [Thermoguttaceae bacterium]
MHRKMVWACGLVLLMVICPRASAADSLPPANRWISPEAIFVVEVSQPEALLDLAFDPKMIEAVASLPAYQKQAEQPGFRQFLQVVRFLEMTLDTPWPTGVRKLVGGGVTLAASADGGALLIVDAQDAQMLQRLHEILLGFAKNQAEKQEQPGRVASEEYRGATCWTFGGDEAHAILGNRLLLANRSEVLKAALDLRAKPDGQSLASSPAYQNARAALSGDMVASAFVNLQPLKQHPPVKDLLTQSSSNPLATLLLAGVTEALRDSSWLAVGLDVEEDTLSLSAVVDGKAGGENSPAAFALPSRDAEGALPNLAVPRRIAAASLYRDLHRFYAAKDDLFPERTSGLIFFENMMGIFFSGMDLTEEVFGETRPEIRVVVAEQDYDSAVGTPQVQFPAFAAVFHLERPAEFAEVVEEAWQKAVGLINFTRGQQAQPGLIIDRPVHSGTKFTVAYFRSPKDADRTNVDARFNFRPALATEGEYLIFSSTEGLAGDLIDALKKEQAGTPKPLAETHSLVELDGAGLLSILAANRENLIRQNMLEEGNTQAEAETQIDLILAVLKYLDEAKLSVGSREGRPQANLKLKLDLP